MSNNNFQNEGFEERIQREQQCIENNTLRDVGFVVRDNINPQPIIRQMHADYNQLISEVREYLKTASGKIKAAIEYYGLANTRKLINSALYDIGKKKNEAEERLKSLINTYRWQFLWVAYALIGLFTLSDSALNFRAFQALGAILLISIGIAFVVAVLIGFAAHFFGGKIREAITRRGKWLWFITSLVPAIIFFFILGLIRQQFYDDNSMLSSPMVWMVWNLFFYVGAVGVSALFLPSKAQWEQKRVYDLCQADYDRIIKEEQSKEAELNQEESKFKELLKEAADHHVKEQQLIEKLEKSRAALEAKAWKEYYLKGGTYDSTDNNSHNFSSHHKKIKL